MHLLGREHYTFHPTASVYNREVEAWFGSLLLAKKLNHLTWFFLNSLNSCRVTDLLHKGDLSATNKVLRLILLLNSIHS